MTVLVDMFMLDSDEFLDALPLGPPFRNLLCTCKDKTLLDKIILKTYLVSCNYRASSFCEIQKIIC